MKVIKTYRKATVQDYARAAAKASPVINGGNDHIIGDIVGTVKDIAGIFKKKPGKISKAEFYKKRDAFFATAKSMGKPVDSLPGNPFTQFSHSNIKDSPFKDYQEDWKAFEQMVSIYYPELNAGIVQASSQPAAAQVAQPLEKVMNQAIQNGGAVAPRGDMSATLEEFNNRIMQPATGKDLSGAGNEALGNAAIEFISTLIEKKQNGETLPPIYDQIASNAMRVKESVENKVRQNVQGNIGALVTDNALVIGAVLVLILLMIMSKK